MLQHPTSSDSSLRVPIMQRPKHLAAGLSQGASIATPTGWRKVSELDVGDRVNTLYGSVQPISKLTRITIPSHVHLSKPKTWPLFIPAGAIGNTHEMVLAPDQPILIESPQFDNLCKSRRAVIKASFLFGHFRIYRVIPSDSLDLVQITFADEQVVYGKEGVLYLCASDPDNLYSRRSSKDAVYYKSLTANDAEMVLHAMPSVTAAWAVSAHSITGGSDNLYQGMRII